jgi:citrate synthase
MNAAEWIDAKTACALLGVKAQTLYAYVSRQRIRTGSDPSDPRCSLYARSDIEALRKNQRRPRARADVAQAAIRWGDPVLSTSISGVSGGMLWYRGVAVADWVQTHSLEETAALLCGVTAFESATADLVPEGSTPMGRAIAYLSKSFEVAHSMLHTTLEDQAAEGARLLSGLTNALLGRNGDGPIHDRFALAWRLNPEGCDAVRRA